MANALQRFWQALNKPLQSDPFTEAFFKYIGGQAAQYDQNAKTYLTEGYGNNPDVYAAVSQMADKTKSVPFYVRSEGEKEKPFPLKAPNPLQSWPDVWALYKVFMKTTGNFFLYVSSPDEGLNKGVPKQAFVLPSHLMKIVLKEGSDLMDTESPISHYALIEGNTYTEFSAEKVIHVKYPNPFYDSAGSHLYGLSPLRSLLRVMEASNEALLGNVKIMKNSGVFGFIAAKDNVLTAEQATQLKQKLREMDSSPERLGKIAGMSVPVEFTKLSIGTDELKPFDFLKYNQKQICNVLGWSDKLLNNDEGSTYNNLKEEKKRLITDNILPDLILLQEALTANFIQKFRGYENSYLDFDVSELPEMQEDYEKLIAWMEKAPLTPNEKRIALNYETIDSEEMNVVWIGAGQKRIDEVGLTIEDVQKAYDSERL